MLCRAGTKPSRYVTALAGLSLALLCSTQGLAQDVWLENGKGAAPRPALAASGQFAIQQIATLDSEGLNRRWNQPTPGVLLDSASTVGRNQPIFTYIIFTGCKADQSGACNVTAVFRMFTPGGQLWEEPPEMPVWVGLPPPASRVLQLSYAALGMVVEDKDPLGAYRVTADVTDHIAGITLHTEQLLTAVAAKRAVK